MARKGYHFYQRVDRHREVLHKKRKELYMVLKNSLKGIARNPRISIHPTHFHVFASVEEREARLMALKIREGTSRLDVKWDSKQYLMPVSSVSEEYVSRLLKDLHREQMI
jgi:hypothetical protein